MLVDSARDLVTAIDALPPVRNHAESGARGERMSKPLFAVNGATLVADRSGALWWREQSVLIVADLHLEKGSSFARTGQLLPPYDSRATLSRLNGAVTRFEP